MANWKDYFASIGSNGSFGTSVGDAFYNGASRVGVKEEKGAKVRYFKKSGTVIKGGKK